MAHPEHEEEFGPRKARLGLRQRAMDWLDSKVPDKWAITSDGKPFRDRYVPKDSPHRFSELTGVDQAWLEQEWNSEDKKRNSVTTCNAFCGKFSEAMGLGSLGMLKLPEYLKRKGNYRAWIPADLGGGPQPGDIVLYFFPGFHHTNVIRSASGDAWITVDGGQGGKKAGHDVITRVPRSFSELKSKGYVQGWVDIDVYESLITVGRLRPILASGALGNLWVDQDGRMMHPDAPAGHGGPGGFRGAGPLSVDVGRTALWHPDAPADLHLSALASFDFAQGRG